MPIDSPSFICTCSFHVTCHFLGNCHTHQQRKRANCSTQAAADSGLTSNHDPLARDWLSATRHRPHPAHYSSQIRTRRTGDESYVYAALLDAAAVHSAAGCLLIAVNHSSLMSPPPTDSADWAAMCLELINRCILSYWRHSDNARLTHDGSLTHSSLSSRLDNGLAKRPTLIIPTVILDK